MKDPQSILPEQLAYLQLTYFKEHYQALADQAAREQWPPVQYLSRLVEGETALRRDRATQRRVQAARFPVIKSLEEFQWTWPKKINRVQVQQLFRLQFIAEKKNLVLLGGVGLGKTHLATALGYAACLAGHRVLFTTAIDIINTLVAAQAVNRLKAELRRYLSPAVLIIDELGYLPIDKTGADLLFQVLSGRYERGSCVITTNLAFKHWAKIFNNDATLTSAVLDRLLHHAESVTIEGKSFRMKDQDPEE